MYLISEARQQLRRTLTYLHRDRCKYIYVYVSVYVHYWHCTSALMPEIEAI